MVFYDGHLFESESDVPDLGSWKCTSTECFMRSYMGLSSDVSRLPTAAKYSQYSDLETGSSALCVDSGEFYFYSHADDTWYKQ